MAKLSGTRLGRDLLRYILVTATDLSMALSEVGFKRAIEGFAALARHGGCSDGDWDRVMMLEKVSWSNSMQWRSKQ